MGDDSGGVSTPAQQMLPKVCITPGCDGLVTATGPGNHKYCNDCKSARFSPAPGNKTKNKRDNSSLSPIETNQTKHSREENFAFAFNDFFGTDFDSFVRLTRQEQINTFQSHFSKIEDATASSFIEISRLKHQVESLTSKLNTAKLALADKHIQLFEDSRSANKNGSAEKQTTAANCNPPSANNNTTNKVNPSQTSYANKTKAQTTVPKIPPKPILIARLDKNTPDTFITEEKIDALLFKNKGPTVQQVKRSENKVTLSFRDEASRDKAHELLSQDMEQDLFQSVFAPHKIFPALVRFHGLDGMKMVKLANRGSQPEQDASLFNERVKQHDELRHRLVTANPDLDGHLLSVRILHNRPDTKSFLVRLSIKSKTVRDKLLESGRILLDNRSHAVVEVDPSREIKHCTRCQKYGHTRNFCGAKTEACGKCSEAHQTSSCTAKQLKCPNCSLSHAAVSASCPALTRAINRFLTYDSTD